jgi:hypothetical protein
MIAVARFCAAAVMPFLLACQDSTSPPGPPYLAIVTTLIGLGGASTPIEVEYRVRDLAGTLRAQRRVRVSPNDTVILSVPPSSYQVGIEGLPGRCRASSGSVRSISLSDADNTGIVRFTVQCLGVVSVAVVASGRALDSGYVFRLRHEDGTEYTGTVAANDTVSVDEAGAGEYTVRLGGVAGNCTIVSDGGALQHVSAAATGGANVAFRVVCSEYANRPQLLSLVGGYDRGASIFSFRVWDPDGDIDGYVWDITDCQGTSVLPDKRERTRRGIRTGRAQLSDTLEVVGAYELGLADSAMVGRCTEVRAFDERGNTSVVLQHRIGSATGFAPTIRFFNSVLQGTSSVTSLLLASDPENDIIGHFVLIRLRDGVLGPPDGKADLGSMDPAGYLGLDVPIIPTIGGRIQWDDVLSVIAYVIDAKGNVIRVEDSDIFK